MREPVSTRFEMYDILKIVLQSCGTASGEFSRSTSLHLALCYKVFVSTRLASPLVLLLTPISIPTRYRTPLSAQIPLPNPSAASSARRTYAVYD